MELGSWPRDRIVFLLIQCLDLVKNCPLGNLINEIYRFVNGLGSEPLSFDDLLSISFDSFPSELHLLQLGWRHVRLGLGVCPMNPLLSDVVFPWSRRILDLAFLVLADLRLAYLSSCSKRPPLLNFSVYALSSLGALGLFFFPT
jgi:hypothetical protein